MAERESHLSTGDAAQTRIIVEQVVEAAIVRLKAQPADEAHIPPILKPIGVIAMAVVTASAIAFLGWMVTTTSDMQLTLTKIEERLKNQNEAEIIRFNQLEDRVERLENYHRDGTR